MQHTIHIEEDNFVAFANRTRTMRRPDRAVCDGPAHVSCGPEHTRLLPRGRGSAGSRDLLVKRFHPLSVHRLWGSHRLWWPASYAATQFGAELSRPQLPGANPARGLARQWLARLGRLTGRVCGIQADGLELG